MIKQFNENLTFSQTEKYYFGKKIDEKQTEQCEMFNEKIMPIMYLQQSNKAMPLIHAKTIYHQQNSTNTNYLLTDIPTIILPFDANSTLNNNGAINIIPSCFTEKQTKISLTTTLTPTPTTTTTIIEHNNNASTSTDIIFTTFSQTINSQQLNQQNLVENNKKFKFANFYPNCNECHGCKQKINDRYLLQVGEWVWHENCLCCAACKCNLAKFNETILSKCYIRNNQVYCKEDYLKLYAEKCAHCGEGLKSTDLVFHCFQRTYHCYCFQCAYCGQSLKHGDQCVYVDGQIICHRDYSLTFLCEIIPNKTTVVETKEVNNQLQSLAFDKLRNHHLLHRSHHSNSKKISKRPRTILNAHQRKAFKYAFERGSKPSRKVREQLAKDTGLSIRVVQVWFQNQRAKVKKEQRKRETGKNFSSQSSLTLSTDSDGKSAVDYELKSPLVSIKSDSDSDSEDFDFNEEVLSGRSSVSQPSANFNAEMSNDFNGESIHLLKYPNKENSNELKFNSTNAIDKLYRMHQTYFAFP